MKKNKNSFIKRLWTLSLVAVFVLAPIRFDLISIEKAKADWMDWVDRGQEFIIEDTTWGKGDHVIDRSVVVENGATLTIEKGARIIFKQDFDETLYLAVGDGRIVAEGAQDEKIIFTSEEGSLTGFYLFFSTYPSTDKVSLFRYVEFQNGGLEFGGDNGGPIMGKTKSKSFLNNALAYGKDGLPAILYESGKVHIENSSFFENSFADISVEGYFDEENPNDFLEVINSNFENNKSNVALVSNVECQLDSCRDIVLLKNNWYGDENGPSGEVSGPTQGESVIGEVVMDGWRKSSVIVDPVVIVPGITGSSNVLGKWKLDPILHSYDDLVDSLENNGYEKDINLFEFPYNWRMDNASTAHYFQGKIENIIQKTKVSKVDVVAHSMGGLVARAYIEGIDGCDYQNTIDQLITLGTPHSGSPEAYLQWEAGEGFFAIKDILKKHYFNQEAEEAGYDDLQKYIREKVVSVGELLPNYDYLIDASSGEIRKYSDNYPVNKFLDKLNSAINIEKMKNVNFINIIGELDKDESTIYQIRTVDSAVFGKWEHGMPENFYDNKTDRGLEYSTGDETVPLESSKGIIADKTIEINSTHGDLPTKAQCEVFKELAGVSECIYEDNWHIPNILLFSPFSPVDIQIIAPDGKRVGKDFENGEVINEIEGAYYTGYDTQNEFVTIPNPIDGKYQIVTQGTENGSYRVEATEISEDEDNPLEAKESMAVFEGEAKEGKTDQMEVEVFGKEVIKKNQDQTPPQIQIKSPEEKQYLNTGSLELEVEISDDVSAQENISVKQYLDGVETDQNEIKDLSFEKIGKHNFKLQAIDEAGNESEKEIVFEITTDLKSIIENIEHYKNLKMIRKNEANVLKHLVGNIVRLEKMVKMIENSKHIKKNDKKRMEKIINERIPRYIDIIEKIIRKTKEKLISPEAKELLISGLEYVKGIIFINGVN